MAVRLDVCPTGSQANVRALEATRAESGPPGLMSTAIGEVLSTSNFYGMKAASGTILSELKLNSVAKMTACERSEFHMLSVGKTEMSDIRSPSKSNAR